MNKDFTKIDISCFAEMFRDMDIALYGAGHIGGLVYDALTKNGQNVTAFLDRHGSRERRYCSKMVYNLDDIGLPKSSIPNTLVLLSLEVHETELIAIANQLRAVGFRHILHYSNKCSIGSLNLQKIYIGKSTIINQTAIVDLRYGGEIEIGENCKIDHGAMLLSHGGRIKIGNFCSINPYCIVYGHGGLTIGNKVMIATHTVIIPSNHNYADRDTFIYNQGETSKGIIIEDDVWIGAGCKILDGITIKQGSVIAAGAVVSRSTEQYGVYAGIPAKKIKERSGRLYE
ncbi:acyltransferase [Anaerospora sp.]|uniref:acyltransferase n=1 Tax=Anaerospora sp. TaxID=1960278 RepID=UPI0028A0F754|nr:acyltransferase [Anaerospora sp.]